MDPMHSSELAFSFAEVTIDKKPTAIPVVIPVVGASCMSSVVHNDTCMIKRLKIEEAAPCLKVERSLGLVHSPNLLGDTLLPFSSRHSAVERPPRATSASPAGSHHEGPLHRNGLRASVGNIPRRTSSPSDKRLNRSFYKDALLRDSANARSNFLSGAWLLGASNARVAGDNLPNATSSDERSTSQGNRSSGKRKANTDAMDCS